MGEGVIQIDLTVEGSTTERTKKWKSNYDQNRSVNEETMSAYLWASKHPTEEKYVCNPCSIDREKYVLLQAR